MSETSQTHYKWELAVGSSQNAGVGMRWQRSYILVMFYLLITCKYIYIYVFELNRLASIILSSHKHIFRWFIRISRLTWIIYESKLILRFWWIIATPEGVWSSIQFKWTYGALKLVYRVTCNYPIFPYMFRTAPFLTSWLSKIWYWLAMLLVDGLDGWVIRRWFHH